MREVFTATVLSRHEAAYDQCGFCGFLRARSPRWLDEAYSRAIAVTDTGIIARNLGIARKLTALCPLLSSRSGPYLDYAGGYGMLTRLMRDRGFDFWWSDKYCENLLASGFEHEPSMRPCIAVTAFEVMEHVERPRAFVEEALGAGQADTLIFSTELFKGDAPTRDWAYYSFETGQHIAFYRHDTLAVLARRLGMHYRSHAGIHMLTRRPIGGRRYGLTLSRPNQMLAMARNLLRPSLVQTDSERMIARVRGR